MSLTEICDSELLQFLLPLGAIDAGLPARLSLEKYLLLVFYEKDKNLRESEAAKIRI